MAAAGTAGFAVVAIEFGLNEGYSYGAGPGGVSGLGSGTVPEQIHLTWGATPSTAVTVSWASPSPQVSPQVTVSPAVGGQSTFAATPLSYTDGLSGEKVYAYHVPLTGLTPSTTYTYVIADPSDNAVTFTSTFTTANTGRFPFAFTSFGDLGTPGAGATYTLADGSTITSTTYSESQWNAYNAVAEVETLAPLFHLLNGDLCYGDKKTISSTGLVAPGSTGVQPSSEVWRDFGLNAQRSAANRPWMPCLGNHEAELDNGPEGYNSFNTRFMLPSNGTAFPGNFYSFEVGSVLFIALDANDICYQGSGAYNVGAHATTGLGSGDAISTSTVQYNQFYTGTFTENGNGTLSPGGTTPNAQTVWLEGILAAARANTAIDWIVVQMHQCAMSSSTDNGTDAAIRQCWVPLFDQYQVDLVVNGHDHDYERSWPVRGFTPDLGTQTWPPASGWSGTSFYGYPPGTPAGTRGTLGVQTMAAATTTGYNTFTPTVVTTDETSPFDTTQGTVYLTLGGGGTNTQDNAYGAGVAKLSTFTQVRVGAAVGANAAGTKQVADASEPAAWSAKTDTTDSYGIAYFSVDPGAQGGNTTITVTYYHAPTQTSGTPNYSEYESFQLTRPRSDNPPALTPEFPMPALVVGGAAIAGGALLANQRRRANQVAELVQSSEVVLS
jgi:Purple acid Phosphatase, N-terminal domain/Calcineurin-like phosphoesterase